MDKKVVFGIMSTVLLLSVLGLTFNIQQVRAEPSTIIVPDDYPTIQKAINAANEGDTIFVRNGTYYENVVVNETVSLVGENRDTTIIDGGGGWVIVVDIAANNVVIRGFTINASTHKGISVGTTSDGYNNTVIQDNKIIDCGWRGIWLQNSYSNNITGNIITSTQAPVGETAQHYDGISVILSDDNVIQGNIISNLADVGIDLVASNNTIRDNEITQIFGRASEISPEEDLGFGIQLHNSHNNSIISNNVTNVYIRGISLNGTSLHNIVRDNNISNCSTGIYLHDSSNYNTVSGNNIAENDHYGIYLKSTSNNTISGNTITENNYNGISLYSSANYNTVSGNNITANNPYGISLHSSSDNIIYHNNFVNNSIQAYVNGSTNVWDDGYPSGGNYWSDYNGTDQNHGVGQNITGSDGIGDTSYNITENDADHYPLMIPWRLPDCR